MCMCAYSGHMGMVCVREKVRHTVERFLVLVRRLNEKIFVVTLRVRSFRCCCSPDRDDPSYSSSVSS